MASRVHGPKEARAAVVALKSVDVDVRKVTNAQSRSVVNPVWQNEVNSRTKTQLDAAVLAKGARVNVGAKPVLTAASSSKALKGGLKPATDWAGFEFGADRNKTTTYRGKSRKGKAYRITRHASRQMPARRKSGRVLYPAIAEVGPRVLSLWAQTSIRAIFDAFQKGV